MKAIVQKMVITGDDAVTIPRSEYNGLLKAKHGIEMIGATLGKYGPDRDLTEAICKEFGYEYKAEPEGAEKPFSPNVPKYANVPLDILPGDKVRYIGQAGKDCGECKAGCYPTPGAVGTVERVGIAIHGDAHSIEVLWPNGRWSGSPSDLAFVSWEGAPC